MDVKEFLKIHRLGHTITIKVTPRAKTTGFLGSQGETVKWGVSSPPEDGKANEELIKSLAKALGIPKRNISILSGEQHRTKVLLISG